MKSILLIAFILFLTNECLKSQLSQEWIRSYNSSSNGNDEALTHATDVSGNVYVSGKILGTGTGFDIYTVKYSPHGNLLWERIYNGTGNENDIGYSIAIDPFGNVYVAGESKGVNSNSDFILLKYNNTGTEQWTQRYNGAFNTLDVAEKVITDYEGNPVVTGRSWEDGVLFNAVTIKYNSDGVRLWISSFNGQQNSNDFADDMASDAEGNIYVCGSTFSQGTSSDFLLIKYSSSGNELWWRTYNGPGGAHDNVTSLTLDPSGNVIIAGSSLGQGTNSDIATIKYSPSGDILWQNRYTTPTVDIEELKAITCDQTGNIILGGTSTGFASSYDYLTIKYSASGDEMWVKNYNGPTSFNFDESSSITADISGNAYIAGFSAGTGTLDDMAIVKYNTSGTQNWVSRYNNTAANGNDRVRNISIDVNGNVIVSGMITGITSGTDFCVIKFSQLTSAGSNPNSVASDYMLYQNYPNPFNPITNIRYSLPGPEFISIKIFNAAGKEIVSLINERQAAGNYSLEWDASGVSSGVYFYRMIAGDFIETRSMIVIK